jgi:4'-phosphopantetheinyl transferase
LQKLVILHYAPLGAYSRDVLARDWLPRLPPAKRASVQGLRDPADRAATLLGVRLLAGILAARGCDFAPERLAYPPRGRPSLPGAPEFSIAHAGALVACAVADVAVGLDLEPRGAVRPEQLRLVTDDVERNSFATGALDATDAWAMKEAVLKAAGRGAHAARAVALRGRTGVLDGAVWHLRPADVGASHVAWLATPLPDVAVEVVGPVAPDVDAGRGDVPALPARR